MDKLVAARNFDFNTISESDKQKLPGIFQESRLLTLTDVQTDSLISNLPQFVNSPQRASFVVLRLCDFTSSYKFQQILSSRFSELSCLKQADKPLYTRLLSIISINQVQSDSLATFKQIVSSGSFDILSAARFARNEELVADICQVTVTELEHGKINDTSILTQIIDNLRKPFQAEFAYASVILFWVLAKQSETISNFFISSGCVGLLCRMLKQHDVQITSKVVRCLLLALKTLNTDKGVEQMIAADLQIVIKQLQAFSWPEGIDGPLAELLEDITSRIKDISTIESYNSQLDSGIMENTPMHTSVVFWKQNCQQFTSDGGFLLKRISEVGQNAIKNNDFTTLQVALNDIGQFAVNHPTGREFLQKVPQILQFSMECLKIQEEEIQSLAISTVAKMLVVDWKAI